MREKKQKAHSISVLILITALVFAGHTVLGQEHPREIVDAQTQEKVWVLLQKVISEHWNGADTSNISATNSSGNETNVEAAFRAASALMPERLDLRLGLASTVVSQALGTNGQKLEVKMKEALNLYQEIAAMDTNGFQAQILFAAYSRALGQTNESEFGLNTLELLHPQRTTEYRERFGRIDRALQLMPNEKPLAIPRGGLRHVIVVLGAGLETNGMMKPKLLSRMQQCLKLSRLHPDSPIILTGGNQKYGMTEAYVMRKWCLKKHIRKKRIWVENKARDTVENAIYVSRILQKIGATDVTLVTSLSHMRRALADFEEACQQIGLTIRFSNLAATAKGDTALDWQQERLGVYRDVMRTSGLWAFPGLQR